MSRIDDLIESMCPNGVVHRPLGDVGTFVRGNGLQKKDLLDEGVGAIHYGQIFTTYGTTASQTRSFVDPAMASRLRRAQPGDLVIATTSENDEDVCKAVAWVGTSEIAISGDAYIYSHRLDPNYVAYYFQTEQFQAQKRPLITGTKVRRVSGSDLARVSIPVPPLEIQREIVGILNAMDALRTELATEAALRSRQYSYYRRSLIESVETQECAVSDLATVSYGLTAKAAPEGDRRFIRITDIDANGKLRVNGAKFVTASAEADAYLVKRGDLLMARTGATYGKTMLATQDMNAVFASFLIRIRVDESRVLPEYYWHFAQTSLYWDQARALVSSGGQPQFNGNVLKTVRLRVPSVEDQCRIVKALEGFDELVNDYATGLPAEIVARRQQYEHYRDRLLTFKQEEVPA